MKKDYKPKKQLPVAFITLEISTHQLLTEIGQVCFELWHIRIMSWGTLKTKEYISIQKSP